MLLSFIRNATVVFQPFEIMGVLPWLKSGQEMCTDNSTIVIVKCCKTLKAMSSESNVLFLCLNHEEGYNLKNSVTHPAETTGTSRPLIT